MRPVVTSLSLVVLGLVTVVVLWVVLSDPPPNPRPVLRNPAPVGTHDASLKDVQSASVPLADEKHPTTSIWEAVDESRVEELPHYWEVVEKRALVKINDFAGALGIGDRISITVPQIDQTFAPVIEEIADGSEGRRSFLGVLHEGSGRRFVITVGPGATLAYIPTPQGTYELVAEGQYGWLMPSVNMDADVDYSTPDYFIPED